MKKLFGKDWMKIIWIISFLVLWEGITLAKWVDVRLLPPLHQVFLAVIQGVVSGELLIQALQSVLLVAGALAICLIIVLVMVYLDYFYRPLKSLFELLSSLLHPLPGIAILPVVILWVGIGLKAVFAIAVHAIVWSLYINVKKGFEQVDSSLLDAAKNNGAGSYQLYRYVLIPSAKHAFFTGIQIGWSRGFRAMISAEMIFGAISALGGIGWFIYERRAFMDTTGMYAGILVVMIIGLLFEQLLYRLTTRY